MRNISIIFTLLVAPLLIASLFHLDHSTKAGRLGICAVFLFAGIGHFLKTDSMIAMLPAFVPARRDLIYLSGIVELCFAIAVVALHDPRLVGWMIVIYLIVIFPSNIYAATQRISFGGHSIGPRYLLMRFPLQLLLILWTYWFCARSH
jgi:uncharacterized membrane protein